MSDYGDELRRFVFEHASVRGELIHLEQTLAEVLARRSYPDAVTRLLGESLAAAGLLSSILKFRGALIIQLQGQGPLPMLVASANERQGLRAIARTGNEAPPEPGARLDALCRNGYLAITIDPADEGERYQGIVPLESDRIGTAVEAYFDQSEQLPTRLWLACDGTRAAGMLLQRLPAADEAARQDEDEAWNRALHLANTLSEDELLELPAREVVRRLFHEEDIRLFDPTPVAFHCECSRSRLAGVLAGLGHAEARAIVAEEGAVEAACEFCGTSYRFDAVDVEQLFADGGIDPPDERQH